MSITLSLTAPSISTEPGWYRHKEHPNTHPISVTNSTASLPPFPLFDFRADAVARRLKNDLTVVQLELKNKGEVRITLHPKDFQRLTNLWDDFIQTVDDFEFMSGPVLVSEHAVYMPLK